jgi:ABC-type antimicrobial peptide transport system permease subunit
VYNLLIDKRLNIWHPVRSRDDMLKNYLKIAFRNLWRSKGFSFINITGLAMGMATAVLILLWIYNEVSYDRFHKNGPNLYQVWNRGVYDAKLQCWSSTPKILGPSLKLEFPEISEISRGYFRWFVTVAGDKKISSSAMITDPAFLKMFSFPLVKGNPETALDNLYSIVVTEKMATKMFGNEDAMNKLIKIDSNNFKVTGVMKDLPPNTAFNFEFILPWQFLTHTGGDDKSWGNNSINTYVQLKEGASEQAVDEKIKNITIRHSNGEEQQEVFLHPISKWHLYSRFENGKIAGGRIEMVRLFTIIAVFILLIACINFMNLSTARSEKRAKEVGIRKMAGANKKILIGQFLGESILMSVIAALVAILIVYISLPAFTNLVNKELAIPIGNVYFWMTGIAFIAITGVVAGSYPAFFLSSFRPISVLKGTFKRTNAAINPRKVLVVLQFTFAIVLIICTFIVTQQIRHAQQREAGYERGQLVYQWLSGDLYDKYPLYKSELLRSGIATSVTKTNSPLTMVMSNTWGLMWDGKAPGDKTEFDIMTADEDLVTTAGLQLVRGRDMNLKKFSTDSSAALLNESAVRAMGFKEPIGQTIRDNETEYHVVGVVKDFVFGSPYENTKPTVIMGSKPNWFNVVHIKLSDRFSTSESIEKIGKLFAKYNPAYPFENHFTDEDYATKFDDTQRTAKLTGLFAALTILISCLGLFGLATYMAETRIKEIGVRKVLGASVLKIAALLSKDFIKLVIISILIASPIAWFAMSNWLQGFSYRVEIQWWVFALTGILSLFISLITVSYQAIRAALVNPVRSLRNE